MRGGRGLPRGLPVLLQAGGECGAASVDGQHERGQAGDDHHDRQDQAAEVRQQGGAEDAGGEDGEVERHRQERVRHVGVRASGGGEGGLELGGGPAERDPPQHGRGDHRRQERVADEQHYRGSDEQGDAPVQQRAWMTVQERAGDDDSGDRGDPEDEEFDVDGEAGAGGPQVRGDVGVDGVVGQHPGEDDGQDHGDAGDPEHPGQGKPGGPGLPVGVGRDHSDEHTGDNGHRGESGEGPPPVECRSEPGPQGCAESESDGCPDGDDRQRQACTGGRADLPAVGGQHPPDDSRERAGDETRHQRQGHVARRGRWCCWPG